MKSLTWRWGSTTTHTQLAGSNIMHFINLNRWRSQNAVLCGTKLWTFSGRKESQLDAPFSCKTTAWLNQRLYAGGKVIYQKVGKLKFFNHQNWDGMLIITTVPWTHTTTKIKIKVGMARKNKEVKQRIAPSKEHFLGRGNSHSSCSIKRCLWLGKTLIWNLLHWCNMMMSSVNLRAQLQQRIQTVVKFMDLRNNQANKTSP